MDRKQIEQMARDCGFAKMGVCSPSAFEQARKRVAQQPPLAERRQLRFDPAEECPWATGLLVLLWPYCPAPLPSQAGEVFVDSYYPASHAAYHASRTLEKRLRDAGYLAQANVAYPAKEAAVRAGLGILGRNSLLITPEYGSRVVIILLATDAIRVDPREDVQREGNCLGCGRCAMACPTGALDENGMSHPERCLRNYMMEGIVVPESVRPLMQMKLLGCDACQRACPMQTLPNQALDWTVHLDDLTQEDAAFSRAVAQLGNRIGKNAARPQRVRAQAALLCGNAKAVCALPALRRWAESEFDAVREHARWAIEQIEAVHGGGSGLDQRAKKR